MANNGDSDLDFERDEESSEQGTVTESNDRVAEPGEDFTVELGGGGIYEPIKWIFPDSSKCLFAKCPYFDSRYEAMAHFKRTHALIATICVPCNKVLLAKSMQQHQLTKTHLNIVQLTKANRAITDEPKSPIEEAKERLIKNPQINFQPQSNSEEVEKQPNRNLLNEIRTKQQRLSIQQIKETKHNGTHNKHGKKTFVDAKHKKHYFKPKSMSSPDEDVFEFNMIDRNERKIWRFPLNSRCPIPHCREKVFPTRNDALKHFQLKHANGAVWCGHCQVILATKYLREGVKLHFEAYHANVSLPTNWTTRLPKVVCPDCGKEYASRTSLAKHAAEHHKQRVFKCTENGCSFQTRKPDKIKYHQYKYHILTKKPNTLKYMDDRYMEKVQVKPSKYLPDGQVKKMTQYKSIVKSKGNSSRVANGSNMHSKKHSPEKLNTAAQPKKVAENPLIIRRSNKKYAFDDFTCSRKLASTKENYECVNCCLKFDSQTTLQNHLHSKHSTRLRMQKCKLCNESIRSKKLNAHYYWQHNRFINKCPFCEQAFIETETFKRHITNEIFLRNKIPHVKENDKNAMNIRTKKPKPPAPNATITSATKRKSLDMPSLSSADESHIEPFLTQKRPRKPNATSTAVMKRKSIDMPLIFSEDESHIEHSFITPKKSKKEKMSSTDLPFGIIKLTPENQFDAKVADCVVSIERLSRKQIKLLTQGQQNLQTELSHTLPVLQSPEHSESKRQQVDQQQLVKAEQQQPESIQSVKTEQQQQLPPESQQQKHISFNEIFGDCSEDDLEDGQIFEQTSKNVSLEEDSIKLQGQMEVDNDDSDCMALVIAETSHEINRTNCSPGEMDTTEIAYDNRLKSPTRYGFTSASEDESFVTVKDLI